MPRPSLKGKQIILDTNAYAAFFAGDQGVLDALGRAETTYMSVIVLGELHAGFKCGRKEAENKKQLAAFLKKSTVHVLDVTPETAGLFGEIKNRLKKAGTPLPINVVWLAAHAAETGAVLITYDKHFTSVPGLRVWDKLKSLVGARCFVPLQMPAPSPLTAPKTSAANTSPRPCSTAAWTGSSGRNCYY